MSENRDNGGPAFPCDELLDQYGTLHRSEGMSLRDYIATRLAMTWEGRISFIMTDSLVIKKLAFLDVVFEGHKQGKEDAFDADVAITTGELSKLIPDLIDALGGLLVLDQAA